MCIDNPVYVASYGPYGRSVIEGSWTDTSGNAIEPKWFTGASNMLLSVDATKLGAAAPGGINNGGPAPGGGGGGGPAPGGFGR